MNETATTSAAPAGAEDSFTARLDRARKIVQMLEQGSLDLETGARLYREACECLTFCRTKLDTVRNEIEILNGSLTGGSPARGTVVSADDFLKRDARSGE